MIKIFIPSYRRPNTTTTTTLLDAIKVPYKLIVRETEYSAYRVNFPDRKLMVIGRDEGLNKAREHVRSTLKKNEWSLHMDDNVRGFVQCKKSFYKRNQVVPLSAEDKMITRANWQATMCEHVSFNEFYDLIIEDTLIQSEKRGVFLAGFSAHENPAFRAKKYTDVGYVCGKTMLMKNQGLSWCQSTESSGEDYALTAAHLYANGRILVNKWGHPLRTHYQEGGCGNYEERLPAMLRAQKELSGRYGDVFGIKNKDMPDKRQGELRIRFNSLKQVELWRKTFKTNPNW